MSLAGGELETAEQHFAAAYRAHLENGQLDKSTAMMATENLLSVRMDLGDYPGVLAIAMDSLEHAETLSPSESRPNHRDALAQARRALTQAASNPSTQDPPAWEAMLETVLPWLEQHGYESEAQELLDATLEAASL